MFQGEYVQHLQTRSNYIRPVRNFGDEAEAFWVEPYLADGTKSGSMKVSPKVTTTYDAVVVFGKDTLPLTGTVVVHEKYDTDTLYEVVCQSTEPYNSTKSSLFTNLDISHVTVGYDTLSRTTHTIHGCDSTVALLLKVVGDCEHFYRDSICPIVTQHDFLPFDTTFLPGTISGVYEHHGKKTVEGTEIDTVAFYDLTIMPEYHLTDDLHLCLDEETTVIPYSENEHVTITVTHGKITLASDDARVVIDSTDKVNGNFVLRMTTEFGCDSLVTLHIDTSSVQFDTVRRADVFIANTPECTDRVIGAQNSTSPYYPLSNYYNYSCSQQIFTSAELGEAGPINTISFNYASATPTTSKTDVKIYLAHTTKNSFNGSYDWVSPDAMTLVYDGELNCANQGWNEFVLNQTFDYNGTDNLLVMVLDESDAGDGWYYFYSTSVPGGSYKTLYYNSTGSYWVPDSYGYIGSYRSDIRFSGCTEDNVFYTTEVAGNSFTVSEPGTYTKTETVTGSNGCDSITKRILIVEEPHYDTICDRIYDEATLMWKDNVTPYCWVYNGKNNCIEGKSENANGFYEFKDTKDIDGVLVDTTSYLKLTVIPTKENEDNIDTCLYENAVSFAYEKDSRITITISTSEGVTVTSSETDVIEVLTVNASTGDFILKTTAANGCDSIVRLNVRYNFVQRDTLTDQVRIAQVVANGNKWTVGGYTFENITEPGVYTLRDTLPGSNGCDSIVVLKVDVLPCPELSIVCPPDHYDTLAFGDCVMEIYPEKIGTPTVTVDPADWPFEVSNDIPADNLYQEGETIITWVATDPVCGYSASCEQKVIVVFPKCPDAVDCEGNVYHGVRIDCDCWTQTNLVSNCYGDANECVETGNCDDPIPCVFEYESGFHPNVDENVAIYGKLYCDTAGVGDSTVNEHGHIQGICPEGWYLPTVEKYADLFLHGDALKSPLYWTDGGGDNSTGFSWLPAGWYNGALQRFEGMGSEGYFLAVETTVEGFRTVVFTMQHDCDEVKRIETHQGFGYSVRCVKEKD